MRNWGVMRAGMLLVSLALLSPAAAAYGAAPGGKSLPGEKIKSTDVLLDVNRLEMFVTNFGSFAYDWGTGNSGLVYPAGTANTALFSAGLWMGARVNGEVRVSVAEYSSDYCPGPIIDGTFPPDFGDMKYRAYKLTPEDTGGDDYDQWPCGDGAPCTPDGKPVVAGDMAIWGVYNDVNRALRTNNASSQNPLGVTVRQTTFAFNRTGALGEVGFLRYEIINNGGNTLQDAYVSIWSDPDLGGASDDLVGCDTTRIGSRNEMMSLGYCYNASNNDEQYGARPPAVGFDFFQGPIVPSPGDTAHVDGVAIPGYRNLPMTSFNKYINGTDPESALETYNYMQGLNKDGTPLTDPSGQVTRYYGAGDPVKGTGWRDSDPADRRMMLSSGPFTMAPGDTQIVVVAVLVGQGADRLTSITALRFNDRYAQFAFDQNFDLPSPPPRPQVQVGQVDDRILLNWGDESERLYNEPGYAFEGYNVYAGETVAGPWQRIFTYDVSNDIGIIFDELVDASSGIVVTAPVQFGTDGGISRRAVIDTDYITGNALRNGKPYYFGVTAYAYNPDAGAGLLALENAVAPITAVPQEPVGGTRLADGDGGSLLGYNQTTGDSDANIEAMVMRPESMVPETYEVRFLTDAEGMYWDLIGAGGRVVLEKQRNLSNDESYLSADGVFWKVGERIPDFRYNGNGSPQLDEIAGPGGAPVGPDGVGGPGRNVWHRTNSTGEWLISAGGGDGGVGRMTRNGGSTANLLDDRDIIMKWDYRDDNFGLWSFGEDTVGVVPFGLYFRDQLTGEETRLIPELVDNAPDEATYTLADYDFSSTDAFSNLPATDWTYAYAIRSGRTYQEFVDDVKDDRMLDDGRIIGGTEYFARLIVVSEEKKLPAAGTIIQFSSRNTVKNGDVYQISTEGIRFDQAWMKDDLEQIRVVPNPYFAHSSYEFNQFEHRVKFTRVPPLCTIRIFNLAGDLVRTLEKDPEDAQSSFLEWNLLTDRRLPVGSGVYIYHVEGKDASGSKLGTTTGRVAVFIEKERLNTR